MSKVKGVDIILIDRQQTGTDPFGRPVYQDIETVIENVLIGSPSTKEVANELNLSGKKLAYILGIPKGDTHNWIDRKVVFWGEEFQTIGKPTQGIEEMIPLEWNRKVKVEKYG